MITSNRTRSTIYVFYCGSSILQSFIFNCFSLTVTRYNLLEKITLKLSPPIGFLKLVDVLYFLGSIVIMLCSSYVEQSHTDHIWLKLYPSSVLGDSGLLYVSESIITPKDFIFRFKTCFLI